MAIWIDDEHPLPSFRDDLELYQGPAEPDGAPSYNLFDPTRGKYFKTNWAESLILQYHRVGITLPELVNTINTHTTLKITKDEVKHFFEEAASQNLLAIPRSSEQLIYQHEKTSGTFLRNLVYNYLYYRLPIFNPDKFLTRTLPFIQPLASRTAFIIYGILSLIGIMMVLNRFELFLSTFTYFFNFRGLLAYALTLSVIKVIHEFAHAYTAKYYRINVPTMGIIFIVLWPMLYTDVTNGWKLWKRGSRIAISAAGCAVEIVMAGLASLGWALTSPGILHSVFFLAASATWISSIFINLNPAMRFDGYYLACDISGIDNLQPRAFAVLRWKVWDFLFGIHNPPPEDNLTPKKTRGMVIYALFTICYRLFLYISVALFVYFTFTKTLGILLAVIELWLFLIWPIIDEILSIKKVRPKFFGNYRLMLTTSIIAIFLLWFTLPLPHTVYFSAITAPEERQTVYVPASSVIEKIYVQREDSVKPGDMLIKLTSKPLQSEIEQVKVEIEKIETQIHIISIEGSKPSLIPRKNEELASTQFNLDRLISLNNELSIKAKIPGTVYLWRERLREGLPLAQDTIIGKIADVDKVIVWAYIPEDELDMVHVGQKVEFMLRKTFDTYKGIVVKVSPSRERILRFPALASVFGGPLAVSSDRLKSAQGLLKMQESYYPIEIEITTKDHHLPFEQTGRVEVVGPWRSKFVQWFRYILGIVWRESGF